MIFFVELWERFGYYGVQGVLAVFFVKQLGFSQEQAFVTFGAFAALVYGLISIGGYVGDHLLGTKRTIVLGALVLAIGYFMTGMSLLKPDLIFIDVIKVFSSLEYNSPKSQFVSLPAAGKNILFCQAVALGISVTAADSTIITVIFTVVGKFDQATHINCISVHLLAHLICQFPGIQICFF